MALETKVIHNGEVYFVEGHTSRTFLREQKCHQDKEETERVDKRRDLEIEARKTRSPRKKAEIMSRPIVATKCTLQVKFYQLDEKGRKSAHYRYLPITELTMVKE